MWSATLAVAWPERALCRWRLGDGAEGAGKRGHEVEGGAQGACRDRDVGAAATLGLGSNRESDERERGKEVVGW